MVFFFAREKIKWKVLQHLVGIVLRKAGKISLVCQKTLNVWNGQKKSVSENGSIGQRLSDWNGK